MASNQLHRVRVCGLELAHRLVVQGHQILVQQRLQVLAEPAEGLVVVETALGGGLVEGLVHVAVVAAQAGPQHAVGDVKGIDQRHHVGAQAGQQLLLRNGKGQELTC